MTSAAAMAAALAKSSLVLPSGPAPMLPDLSRTNSSATCGKSSRAGGRMRSEEHTSELQSLRHLVCRLLLEKKKIVTDKQRRVRPRALGQILAAFADTLVALHQHHVALADTAFDVRHSVARIELLASDRHDK